MAWINLAVLLLSTLLFLHFYVLSVGPAALERAIGEDSYRRCGRYRVVAVIFETITVINYVLYRFYPVSTPLPESFPWPWWVSALIAAVIGIPTTWLMVIGMKDAGSELAFPKKEHTMYGGIYTRIRHPQAAGEVFGWLWIGFLLHSPFLVAFSFIYFPVFLIMCWAEEADLLVRYGDAYADYWRKTGAFFPRRGAR